MDGGRRNKTREREPSNERRGYVEKEVKSPGIEFVQIYFTLRPAAAAATAAGDYAFLGIILFSCLACSFFLPAESLNAKSCKSGRARHSRDIYSVEMNLAKVRVKILLQRASLEFYTARNSSYRAAAAAAGWLSVLNANLQNLYVISS